jgi:peptidoglycan hydrolase CwlO-like protein
MKKIAIVAILIFALSACAGAKATIQDKVCPQDWQPYNECTEALADMQNQMDGIQASLDSCNNDFHRKIKKGR